MALALSFQRYSPPASLLSSCSPFAFSFNSLCCDPGLQGGTWCSCEACLQAARLKAANAEAAVETSSQAAQRRLDHRSLVLQLRQVLSAPSKAHLCTSGTLQSATTCLGPLVSLQDLSVRRRPDSLTPETGFRQTCVA